MNSRKIFFTLLFILQLFQNIYAKPSKAKNTEVPVTTETAVITPQIAAKTAAKKTNNSSAKNTNTNSTSNTNKEDNSNSTDNQGNTEKIGNITLPKKDSLFTESEVKFKENWGYVSMSRANEYSDSLPLTDVCFFSADVNAYGELIDVPKRSALRVTNKRTHLVFVCDSRSLTHFVLSPEYPIREQIENNLVEAVRNFDGLQIDLELIPARDGKYYISFLEDLRKKLGNKMLTVCVPARFRKLTDDIYPYDKLAEICDRVFIMAYDEHWSTSAPGPIASVGWCEKVLAYAQKTIPNEKLIMGMPFYGRTWADKSTSGAWYFSGANRIMRENNAGEIVYENDIPKFTYTTQVKVTGYMNDVHSVLTLCNMYKKNGVSNIGFWRIGQEDPDVWKYIKLEK